MNSEKDSSPTKQSNLSDWATEEINNDMNYEVRFSKNNRSLTNKNKPRLAFGYGYDPNILKNGIKDFSFSHKLDNELKLYEFQPNISYRIFNILANILKYKCQGSELRKDKTIIKNKYFVTDRNPEEIIKELNDGIKSLFKNYDPIPKSEIK